MSGGATGIALLAPPPHRQISSKWAHKRGERLWTALISSLKLTRTNLAIGFLRRQRLLMQSRRRCCLGKIYSSHSISLMRQFLLIVQQHVAVVVLLILRFLDVCSGGRCQFCLRTCQSVTGSLSQSAKRKAASQSLNQTIDILLNIAYNEKTCLFVSRRESRAREPSRG